MYTIFGALILGCEESDEVDWVRMERMDDDEVLDRNINGVMVDLFACNPFLEDAETPDSRYREEIRRRDDAMVNYCCLSMIVCSK